MSVRYHYDKHGNYRGWSSNSPPDNDGGGFLVGISVVMLLACADQPWMIIPLIILCIIASKC